MGWQLKEALRSVAKTFAGDSEVMTTFGDASPQTDCGKAILIRDPDLLVKQGLSEHEADDIAASSTAHEAAHIKFKTDMGVFKRAVLAEVVRGADRELVFRCVNLAEDQRVDTLMGRERPGYLEIRDRSVRAFVPKLYKPTGSKEMDLNLILTAATVGVELRWKVEAEDKAKLIKAEELMAQAKEAKDTAEAARLGVEAYKVLHSYGKPISVEDKPPAMPTPSLDEFGSADLIRDDDGPMSFSKGKKDLSSTEEEDFEYEGEGEEEEGSEGKDEEESDEDGAESEDGEARDEFAEDCGDDEVAAAELLKGSSTELDMLKKWLDSKADEVLHGDAMAEGLSEKLSDKKAAADERLTRFDEKLKTLWAREAARRTDRIEHTSLSEEIERAHSKEANAGVQIWYATNSAIESYIDSRRKLDKCLPVMISGLTQALKDTLRKARERDTYLHLSGVVRADRAWRGNKLGDGRVFIRHEEKATGGYAVKLLLDASGSMGHSSRSCAVVSYALVKALLAAGFPVSVEAFEALSGGPVVHWPLLHWGDVQAERVLAYHASGENRDGYSIRAAAYELSKRSEQYKILIVLSDGCPCHGGHSEAIAVAGGIPGGCGGRLNDDAARAVREVRAMGIKVLGVYFGRDDKDTEQLIYGKDFIPVTDLPRFAAVARTYLSRIIQGG